MDGFERRRQQKMEDILKAALTLFQQYGFQKVSMNDIAQKANVSAVSIYNFFGSKDNLYKKLIDTLWDEHYQKLMSILNSSLSTHDKIKQFFFTVAGYPSNHSMHFLATSIQNLLSSPDSQISKQMAEIDQALIRMLKDGKEQGVLRPNISTQAVLGYIEMFRYYFIHNPEAASQYDKNPEFLEEMIRIYLNALLVDVPE